MAREEKWFVKFNKKKLSPIIPILIWLLAILLVFSIIAFYTQYIHPLLLDILSYFPSVNSGKTNGYFYSSLESVATFIGAVIALVSVTLFLYDSFKRTSIEKEGLEINRREQRAFLRIIPIQRYASKEDSPNTSFEFGTLETVTPIIRGITDSNGDPIPATNFKAKVYDIHRGSCFFAIENVGKGMAKSIKYSISSNEKFPENQTVIEEFSFLPPGDAIITIKDLRYPAASIAIDDNNPIYIKVSFESYFTKEEKEIVFKGTIFQHTFNDGRSIYYIPNFAVISVSDDGNKLTT